MGEGKSIHQREHEDVFIYLLFSPSQTASSLKRLQSYNRLSLWHKNRICHPGKGVIPGKHAASQLNMGKSSFEQKTSSEGIFPRGSRVNPLQPAVISLPSTEGHL